MAKNLASKLRTGAMVGLAALAVSVPMKAKAGFIPYNSGAQSVTNVVADGKLILDYYQTINEIDTDNNGSLDAYQSILNVYNRSEGGVSTNKSYFLMKVNADLAGRGCTGLTNEWLNWTYSQTGADSGQFLMPSSGEWPLFPGTSDKFYYTIPTNQVIGWENVNAQISANDGAVSFGFQVPKAIPEPLTAGLLASGALVTLAARRMRENAKRR